MSEDSTEKPAHFRPTEMGYKHKPGNPRANIKARNKAKTLNALMKHQAPADPKNPHTKAILPVSGDSLKRYLLEDDFQQALVSIAPYMSATALGNVLDIAEGVKTGNQGASDTQLRANLEILKGFMPHAQDGASHVTFDAGERRARAEAREGAKLFGVKEVIKALASDPFRDYGKEIGDLRRQEAAGTPGSVSELTDSGDGPGLGQVGAVGGNSPHPTSQAPSPIPDQSPQDPGQPNDEISDPPDFFRAPVEGISDEKPD